MLGILGLLVEFLNLGPGFVAGSKRGRPATTTSGEMKEG